MHTHTYTVAIEFNQVFRSWAVKRANELVLIIKTGFIKPVGTPDWPLHLHNFIVYDGSHKLLGTLEPLMPLPSARRRFEFHRHSRNDLVQLNLGFENMDEVIFELLDLLDSGELVKP